jgi:hypothetical protein
VAIILVTEAAAAVSIGVITVIVSGVIILMLMLTDVIYYSKDIAMICRDVPHMPKVLMHNLRKLKRDIWSPPHEFGPSIRSVPSVSPPPNIVQSTTIEDESSAGDRPDRTASVMTVHLSRLFETPSQLEKHPI